MSIVILLLALVLRLISLNQSLWLDEATQVLASRDRGFGELITGYAVGDFHPPLYHAVLWLWFHLVPATEVYSRIPSVLFGCLTVFLTYRFALQFGRAVATLSALFLAVSPLHIYYSQDARMYALACFLVILSMVAMTKNRWFLYTASLLGLVWTEYVPYLIFLPQSLFVRSSFRSFVLAWGIAFLSLLPWLPYFWRQLEIGRTFAQTVPEWGRIVGGLEWKTVPLTLDKFVLGRFPISEDLLGRTAQGALMLMWYGVMIRGMLSKKAALLTAWFLVPLAGAFIISLAIPVFSYFRILYVLPPMFILFVLGALSLTGKLRYAVVLGAIVLEVIMSSLYLTRPDLQRENWRGAVSYIEQSKLPVAFYLHVSPDPYRYYAKVDRSINMLNGVTSLSDP